MEAGNMGYGNMRQETDSVLATFVAKYVQRYGIERAIERLSRINTPQAKRALGLINVMFSEKKQQTQTRKIQTPPRRIAITTTITTRKRGLHPKDYFINTCYRLGITPDQAEADKDFKPLITVKWTGKTTFNGKKLLIPRELLNGKAQMLQYGSLIKFRVYMVKDDRIIAEPIKVIRKAEYMDVHIIFRGKRLICLPVNGKRVLLPKQYLQQLLKELIPVQGITYVYRMQKLNENDQGIVAKPIRLITSKTSKKQTQIRNIEAKIKELKERGRIVLSP